MNRLKLKPRALLPLAPIILFMFAGVRPRTYFAADVTIPPFFIVNDAQGPNDVPGQKDLTRLGRWNHSAIGDPLNGNLDIFASFDSIDPESQTFNFCALLDKNGNGKAEPAE